MQAWVSSQFRRFNEAKVDRIRSQFLCQSGNGSLILSTGKPDQRFGSDYLIQVGNSSS
jgi:hypothetical protein